MFQHRLAITRSANREGARPECLNIGSDGLSVSSSWSTSQLAGFNVHADYCYPKALLHFWRDHRLLTPSDVVHHGLSTEILRDDFLNEMFIAVGTER